NGYSSFISISQREEAPLEKFKHQLVNQRNYAKLVCKQGWFVPFHASIFKRDLTPPYVDDVMLEVVSFRYVNGLILFTPWEGTDTPHS
ncbi:hypothetical protein HAX54_025597, partial [Datura stramonium]|nr:hypothetical protein [Datura stramonium]